MNPLNSTPLREIFQEALVEDFENYPRSEKALLLAIKQMVIYGVSTKRYLDLF